MSDTELKHMSIVTAAASYWVHTIGQAPCVPYFIESFQHAIKVGKMMCTLQMRKSRSRVVTWLGWLSLIPEYCFIIIISSYQYEKQYLQVSWRRKCFQVWPSPQRQLSWFVVASPLLSKHFSLNDCFIAASWPFFSRWNSSFTWISIVFKFTGLSPCHL